jgi:hypothetical protein
MQRSADAAVAPPSPDITPSVAPASLPSRFDLKPAPCSDLGAVAARSLKFTFLSSVTVAATVTGH